MSFAKQRICKSKKMLIELTLHYFEGIKSFAAIFFFIRTLIKKLTE